MFDAHHLKCHLFFSNLSRDTREIYSLSFIQTSNKKLVPAILKGKPAKTIKAMNVEKRVKLEFLI